MMELSSSLYHSNGINLDSTNAPGTPRLSTNMKLIAVKHDNYFEMSTVV
jgi:hypothetical protein